jgi:hypothetical protein
MGLKTTTLGVLGAIGLLWSLPVGAAPITGSGLQQPAMTAWTVQQTQYYERHRYHSIVKCYRELVVGPYVCHRFHRWWW